MHPHHRICLAAGFLWAGSYRQVEHNTVCVVRWQRKDDTPEVVGERLKLYHDSTEPVVEYYRDLNKCETFTGEATNEIYPRLYSYVRGWLRGQLK